MAFLMGREGLFGVSLEYLFVLGFVIFLVLTVGTLAAVAELWPFESSDLLITILTYSDGISMVEFWLEFWRVVMAELWLSCRDCESSDLLAISSVLIT